MLQRQELPGSEIDRSGILSLLLRCPNHGDGLSSQAGNTLLVCDHGCEFPIVNGVPRFLPSQSYASSFGLQWNTFTKTQLDSYTGTSISRDRLRRIAGGSLDVFEGKLILEAGCGAGRFTEAMLNAGGRVFATDLSSAVEANRRNCGGFKDHFVCQADLRKLPVEPRTFDVVVCIGVLQHTPNPEESMQALCNYLKPGGLLLIDHYAKEYPATPIRQLLRWFLLRASPEAALGFCVGLVNVLWPLHASMWRLRKTFPFLRKVSTAFLLLSPVVDYFDAYPELGHDRLKEWAILDTHDTLTDRYKHLRSTDQLSTHLKTCGMVSIVATYAGNGAEVRAVKQC